MAEKRDMRKEMLNEELSHQANKAVRLAAELTETTRLLRVLSSTDDDHLTDATFMHDSMQDQCTVVVAFRDSLKQ